MLSTSSSCGPVDASLSHSQSWSGGSGGSLVMCVSAIGIGDGVGIMLDCLLPV